MSEEDILQKFYDNVSKSGSLSVLDIPPSKVFFVRRAIENATGVCYTIEHTYCSLFLEGLLDPYKHFLNGLPQWYVDKYLEGKHPDMSSLRSKLKVIYQRHLDTISDSAELKVEIADNTVEGSE